MKNFVEVRTLKDDRVYYVRKSGSYYISAPQAHLELKRFIIKHNLDLPGKNKKVKIYGIPYDNPCITPNEECRFDACITVSKKVPVEKNINIQTIQGGKYAVFLHKGSCDTIGSLYHSVYRIWLPENSYNLRNLPAFQVYLNSPEKVELDNLLTEVYFPIE